MTAWIALVLSSLALLVSMIAQRDKLLSFFDELKKRITENVERKRALVFVSKLSNTDSRQPSLLSLYIPVFLISLISSAALSYLGRQPQFYNTILLSASIYFSISMIVLVTFLVASRRFEWRLIASLFVAVLMVSILWGICVIVIDLLKLGTLWTGVLAGIAVILFLVNADWRSSRQEYKK